MISCYISVLKSIRSLVLDYETPRRQHDAEDAVPRKIERNMVRKLLADMAALREDAAEILTARMTSPSNEHEERIPSGYAGGSYSCK